VSFDLDPYLSRIGYPGPRLATWPVLAALHELHPRAIAFDSVDPWLGRPVSLDIEALQQKLVHEGRGGYCYEHNTLFWAALEALGFEVQGLSARVLYSTPPGGGRHPRNHMLMKVETPDGPCIADVGFGGLTLTAPLRLEDGIIQTTPHERVRLKRVAPTASPAVVTAPETWILEAEAGEQWRAMYQFGLEEHIAPDYDVANFYMSRHPRSPFVVRLVAARPLPGRRLALAGTGMSIHHTGGPSEKRTIKSADELRRVLTEDFAIGLPDDPGLDARLAALIAQGT
jgi:N-hydroxyarylamine O-acetyltransferase